ncbi:MAG: DUF2975 domain-containing protein [Candidatus Limiplasma sp.]|nr:DUF2975 domain-containing protein [Candidatus Limiplasma sp.]MEA5145432.1 DUF2975 domain-containing protein [Candidatus Limiplasma sp.]
MKLTHATVLLKAVLVLSFLLLALVVFGGVPAYMAHIIQVRPDVAGWDYWMRAYALVVALPVWAVMALLWRTFDTIPRNNAFCLDNVKRFRRIALLAAADLVPVVGLGVLLVALGVTPPFIMMALMAATYGGVIVAIVFHVLAGLLQNAVVLKQDSDMTI